MTCVISQEELIGVVDEIFHSMAGMQLTPSATIVHPDKEKGYVVSAVQIVGDWKGAVRLDTDMQFARLACAQLLGVDPADLSYDDIRDAAGELANITGGSVKTLLAPTGNLSLPSVVLGQSYEFFFPQVKSVRECSFLHSSGVLLVTVLEKPA
jgi:chemotaxis protein CheX